MTNRIATFLVGGRSKDPTYEQGLAACVRLRPALRCRVAFEQELRVYLEELALEALTAPAPRNLDEGELHRHFLARVRSLETAGHRDDVARLFDQWPNQLARFARYLERLPSHLAPVDRQTGMVFACRALDLAIGCLDPDIALVDRLELQRVVRGFVRVTAMVESYALENRLTREDLQRLARITELGRVFLRLRGKDAIRWLVTNEVMQSTGPFDRWHTTHELLEEAATTRGVAPDFVEGDGRRKAIWGYSFETLDRLSSFGVLFAVVDGPDEIARQFRTEPAMRDVVEAVVERGPWHTAIRALLDDERAAVLPGSSTGAAEATVEQTKLIAHEVRNALIPVRHDIDALRSSAMEPAQSRRIEAAKQGVVRVLEFVDAMVQMSELITEPSTRCEIGAVVDEALGWIDTGQRVERVPFAAGAVHLLAPRARLARAISNIVGNALQATSEDQPVRVSIARGPGIVRILVDDGGPGVPIEHRARVFLEGVTMRQDGAGSGFGLAFARRVVEGALHGKVWCEHSDLGGARFVIEVPEPSE